MFRLTLAILLVLFLASCSDRKSKQSNTAINLTKKDFGDFTIEIPDNWTEIEEDGPDFAFKTYVNLDKDTFGLYIGHFAHYPEFMETYIFDSSQRQSIDTLSEKPSFNYDFGDKRTMDRNRVNHRCLIFETINGINARFIYPRDRQKGNIQFYIDSLGKDRTQVDFWGKQLSADKQDLFFKVCRTIKTK